MRTSSSRKIFGELRVELGEFFAGTRRGFGVDATNQAERATEYSIVA